MRPWGGSKANFVTTSTTRHRALSSPWPWPRPRRRTPLLARLGVGAKLMLLVLLPVAVLLGFTIAGSVNAWRNASSLSDFRSATEQSFVAS